MTKGRLASGMTTRFSGHQTRAVQTGREGYRGRGAMGRSDPEGGSGSVLPATIALEEGDV